MKNNSYAGIEEKYTNFENAKIILQSIPYDGTSTWGKGADKGFKAFMNASENMELYDIETNTEVYKEGVHITSELKDFDSPEDMFEKTYQRTKELMENNKFLTFFGGEHSISIGIIKAFYEKYENLTVVQIDAHADLRPEYNGSAYNHACALYDASKNANLVQVGIRSMDKSELEHMDMVQTFFMEDIVTHEDWMETSLEQMTENVYITLDLDAIDPSLLPGTGTPEPGGFDWYELLLYLRVIFSNKNVVGFDIVELAPIKGSTISEFLVAKLYYKMLSYKFSS